MTTHKLSKQEAMNYLLRYHHLTEDTKLSGTQGILDYFTKVRTIQFDPLNVVGRNPDIVLFSRVADYSRPMLDSLLYDDFTLLDHWDKNMSIILTEDFHKLAWFREKRELLIEEHQEKVDFIVQFIQKNGPITSSDLPFTSKVNAGFGTLVESTALLELMMHAGIIVVVKKIGNRKQYDLASHKIPLEVLQGDADLSVRSSETEYVFRRIQATGLIWNRPSDAFLGRGGIIKSIREAAFLELVESKLIDTVEIEGSSAIFYLPAIDSEKLAAMTQPILTSTIRFIAPLDNMLWDRKLIFELTGFEYKWEVYTPQASRMFGYYVLPILCGDTFIGRIEFDHFSKTKTLELKNIWSETNIPITADMLSEEIERLELSLKMGM